MGSVLFIRNAATHQSMRTLAYTRWIFCTESSCQHKIELNIWQPPHHTVSNPPKIKSTMIQDQYDLFPHPRFYISLQQQSQKQKHSYQN